MTLSASSVVVTSRQRALHFLCLSLSPFALLEAPLDLSPLTPLMLIDLCVRMSMCSPLTNYYVLPIRFIGAFKTILRWERLFEETSAPFSMVTREPFTPFISVSFWIPIYTRDLLTCLFTFSPFTSLFICFLLLTKLLA